MPTDDRPPSGVELLIRIDERTKTMAKDIEDIKASNEKKVGKEECQKAQDHKCRKISEVKEIAISRRSKEECDDRHKKVDEKVDEQKSDWKFWVTTICVIILGVISVGTFIRSFV